MRIESLIIGHTEDLVVSSGSLVIIVDPVSERLVATKEHLRDLGVRVVGIVAAVVPHGHGDHMTDYVFFFEDADAYPEIPGHIRHCVSVSSVDPAIKRFIKIKRRNNEDIPRLKRRTVPAVSVTQILSQLSKDIQPVSSIHEIILGPMGAATGPVGVSVLAELSASDAGNLLPTRVTMDTSCMVPVAESTSVLARWVSAGYVATSRGTVTRLEKPRC